jgi:hypothetical protein
MVVTWTLRMLERGRGSTRKRTRWQRGFYKNSRWAADSTLVLSIHFRVNVSTVWPAVSVLGQCLLPLALCLCRSAG